MLRNTEVCHGKRKRSHSRQSRNGSPSQPESLAGGQREDARRIQRVCNARQHARHGSGHHRGRSFRKSSEFLRLRCVDAPIGLFTGHSDFSNKFINLSGHAYATLAEAKAAGAATINYGVFFNAVFDFLIVAFVVFMLNSPGESSEKRTKGIRRDDERLPILPLCCCDQSNPLSALHLRFDNSLG